MADFGVAGGDSNGNDGLDDPKEDGLLTLDGGILDPISFELTDEAPVQAGVSLGVRGVYRVKEEIQDMGVCNLPPFLRNRFFP